MDYSSKQLKKPEKSEVATLTCLGCGKIGVSVCAKCAKSKGRILAARSCPLKERDPELYKRLDDLSQRPLEGNKQLWDEFCVEIDAQQYYEYLPVLKEVIDEGLWRTDAVRPLRWVRENFARRVEKLYGRDDYRSDGRRRPSYRTFDGRSGALITFSTQPFAEFGYVSKDGDTVPSDEAIDNLIAERDAKWRGHPIMPADTESRRLLGNKTLTSWVETGKCRSHLYALQHDRPAFDDKLSEATSQLQQLVASLKLDQDESEVLAVIVLLWAVGARTYLGYIGEAHRKRIRNAWDRLDRRLKKPEFSRLLRSVLREGARKRRGFSVVELRRPSARSQPKLGSRGGWGIPLEIVVRWHTQLDQDSGLLFPPAKDTPSDLNANDGSKVVDMSFDLTPKQRALYRSSANKPKPRRKTKLYSE
jgi:hypothetical protein